MAVWIYVDTSKDVGDKESRRWGLISGGLSLRMMSSLTYEFRWLTRIVK